MKEKFRKQIETSERKTPNKYKLWKEKRRQSGEMQNQVLKINNFFLYYQQATIKKLQLYSHNKANKNKIASNKPKQGGKRPLQQIF